jgi:hypothetical protein
MYIIWINIGSYSKQTGETKMKNYKVTVKSATGFIDYDVVKTLKGAQSFAKKIANEAFYGEKVEITIEEIK